MESQKKVVKGIYVLIAQKCGCSPKYVSLVMNDKLGKYSERKTKMVEKIRNSAAELLNFLDSES